MSDIWTFSPDCTRFVFVSHVTQASMKLTLQDDLEFLIFLPLFPSVAIMDINKLYIDYGYV